MLRYCVIGFPIKHSLSPRIHNRAFRALKIAAKYEAAEVAPADLGHFMREFRARYAGANVTIPHKEKIMRYLDEVSAEAQKIEAVNTIVHRRGKLIGYNTDVFGAMGALKKYTKLKGKKAVVLGAGGAARAIIYGLKKAGARVKILNRTVSHAQKLARVFGCQYGKLEDFSPTDCDVLINTTSVGMWPKMAETPLPDLLEKIAALSMKRKKPLVMDIVYRPRLTKLLRDAKKAGCPIITGDEMFLAQAVQSFKLWTKEKMPR